MNFINANNAQPTSGITSAHYVLMLDRSGSMSGQAWNDLMKAVERFLGQLEKRKELKQNSKITLIGYDNKAQQICYCVEPSISLIQQIKFSGGGTNFDLPLQMAYQNIQNCLNMFEKHILCMMSVGYASYPSNEIENIQKNNQLMNKLLFYAIGYGNSSFAELKRMAKDLRGKMKTIIEPEELVSAFLKLIQNAYY